MSAYVKTVWVNDTAPAVNDVNLNKIEQGIYDAHVEIDTKVTIPASIAAGEVPVWNGSAFARSSVTKIGLTSLPTTPVVFISNATAQSMGVGWNTFSGATYTEVLDTDAMHDPATNPHRITITTAGLYRFDFATHWTADSIASGTGFGARLTKNGAVASLTFFQPRSSVNDTTVPAFHYEQCAAGAYFQVDGYNGAGVAVNGGFYLAAMRIGP